MKRGEIWIAAGAGPYASKPRPVAILQDDRFDATNSIVVCPFTTDPADLPLFRIEILPDGANGLRAPCRVMIDKVSALPRRSLDVRIGSLSGADIVRVNRALLLFIGMASVVAIDEGAANSA